MANSSRWLPGQTVNNHRLFLTKVSIRSLRSHVEKASAAAHVRIANQRKLHHDAIEELLDGAVFSSLRLYFCDRVHIIPSDTDLATFRRHSTPRGVSFYGGCRVDSQSSLLALHRQSAIWQWKL